MILILKVQNHFNVEFQISILLPGLDVKLILNFKYQYYYVIRMLEKNKINYQC